MNGGHMYGLGTGGIVVWLLLIAVVVAVVYFMARQRGGGGSSSTWETPLEVLKKRYARGEISKEEYERMKRDLLE